MFVLTNEFDVNIVVYSAPSIPLRAAQQQLKKDPGLPDSTRNPHDMYQMQDQHQGHPQRCTAGL